MNLFKNRESKRGLHQENSMSKSCLCQIVTILCPFQSLNLYKICICTIFIRSTFIIYPGTFDLYFFLNTISNRTKIVQKYQGVLNSFLHCSPWLHTNSLLFTIKLYVIIDFWLLISRNYCFSSNYQLQIESLQQQKWIEIAQDYSFF